MRELLTYFHGALEKWYPICYIYLAFEAGYLHGWKAVAPLKHMVWDRPILQKSNLHGWKAVAPLKLYNNEVIPEEY